MRSKISWGRVDHWRAGPKEHSFSYPIFTFELDLDELDTLSISPRLFGYEKRALFSIRSNDYLEGTGGLREKVERILKAHGQPIRPDRITLITMPRYFGYVFNPVSFFACFDQEGRVLGLITQVSNTFGESHIYPLVSDSASEPALMPVSWRFPKEFFVSPFFDREGEYSVTLRGEGEKLSVQVDLERDNTRVFSALLQGDAQPLSARFVLATIRKYPITSFMTMPRIHREALNLYFKVGATPYPKPSPANLYTIRSRQNIIHRARLGLLAFLRACRGRGKGKGRVRGCSSEIKNSEAKK